MPMSNIKIKDIPKHRLAFAVGCFYASMIRLIQATEELRTSTNNLRDALKKVKK